MDKITVADYLIQELNKLGIEEFFGLPGDYNFNILDAVIKNNNTKWIGCTNELNAGYAADGYARIKGCGALITTYGVGELSAVNAIAGSYAETVPVIKITGVPATKFINNKTMLHHNFQEPLYSAFERVYSNVSAGTAFLSFENAKEEIDRILSLFLKEKRPVYLAIPVDVCMMEIENSPQIRYPQSDSASLDDAANHALRLLEEAKKPAILADVLIERFDAKDIFTRFMKNSRYPVSTLLMGKDIIDEDYEYFMGTFMGEYGNIEAYKTFEKSDCPICIGTVVSDLNTMRFTIPFIPDNFINIQGNYCIIENILYENVMMKDLLSILSEKVREKETVKPEWKMDYSSFNLQGSANDEKLSSDYIYPRLEKFFKPMDMIFSETGIITYAMAPMKLPKGATLDNQVLWGSIGWATPASFGGAMADKSRRTILITGEGSHQLTALEIGNMMKHGLKPLIFVVNNSGYTIERLLSNTPEDEFNDIIKMNYTKLPSIFEGKAKTYQARTNKEFNDILIELENNDCLCYVELFTEMMDVPVLTNRVIKGIKELMPINK